MIIPTVMAGIKTVRYESPEASITRISLSLVILPTVIRVPTRDAKGADIAIIEGMEKSMSKATWGKGTCLVRISCARSNNWFTKNIKKKKRNETRNENKVSFRIYQ
jgi:hypothetical protein